MTNPDAVRMDSDQRNEFLGRSGTGVVSLSTAQGDPPHSIPISYGYDPVEEVFYFRLATDGDTEKGELDDQAVSFVTYGEHDGRWKSVVAQGRLLATTDESVSRETLEGLERIPPIPIIDIFGGPTSQVDFEFYRLDPDRLTSRIERSTDP